MLAEVTAALVDRVVCGRNVDIVSVEDKYEHPKIKKISIIIARMTMGGVSSSSISYKETQAVIKKHFGIVAYFLVILKHFSYLTLKKLFKFLKIDFHKG